MINFLMIFGDFGVFSLMVTEGHLDGRMDGYTNIWTGGRTDRHIEMRGRI